MRMSLLPIAFVLLLGAAVAAGHSRRRFRRIGDAFRCRLRAYGLRPAAWPRLTRRWSRPMWAAWVGDALIVRRGPVFARKVRLHATVTPAGVYVLPPDRAKRCGYRPIAVCVRARDGSCVEVAAEEEARLAMVGPFLAAAINDLPEAPVPRRQR